MLTYANIAALEQLSYTPCGLWMPVYHFMAFLLIVVEMFQSGLKYWPDQQTFLSLQLQCYHGIESCNKTSILLWLLCGAVGFFVVYRWAQSRVLFVLTRSRGSVHWGVVSLSQEEGRHHTMRSRRGVRLISCQAAQRGRNTGSWILQTFLKRG